MFAGQVIEGACRSFTVTAKLQLELFDDASLTEQVTVVVPFANEEPEAGVQVGLPTPGQLSLTVGAAYATTAEQRFGSVPVVMFAGQVIEGGCVSLTVTVKLHDELFGGVAASLTEQVTVVVPLGNAVPLAGTQVTAPTPGQLSDAVAANVVTAVHTPGSVPLVMFEGQEIAGGCRSLMVTVNEQDPAFPLASVAEQVTVVVPLGKLEPDGGVQVTVPTPGQLSVAVGVA